jgi:Protein of unknown function (DUF4232)
MKLHRSSCGQVSSVAPAVVVALLATGGGQALAAVPQQPSSPVVCTVDTVSVTIGPISGTGARQAPLRFADTASRPCVIHGFPRVAYLKGAEGAQVGRAAQTVGPRLGPVTLQPGQIAFAPLTMVPASTYGQAVCQPTSVGGLQVYPPNDARWVFVPLPGGATVCASNPPSPQLEIGSVEAGAAES